MILKFADLEDMDKLEIKNIVEDITCSTCKKYGFYINTHFMCPEREMKEVHGKNICTSWELDEEKFNVEKRKGKR